MQNAISQSCTSSDNLLRKMVNSDIDFILSESPVDLKKHLAHISNGGADAVEEYGFWGSSEGRLDISTIVNVDGVDVLYSIRLCPHFEELSDSFSVGRRDVVCRHVQFSVERVDSIVVTNLDDETVIAKYDWTGRGPFEVTSDDQDLATLIVGATFEESGFSDKIEGEIERNRGYHG